jgi:hypothetical protein
LRLWLWVWLSNSSSCNQSLSTLGPLSTKGLSNSSSSSSNWSSSHLDMTFILLCARGALNKIF